MAGVTLVVGAALGTGLFLALEQDEGRAPLAAAPITTEALAATSTSTSTSTSTTTSTTSTTTTSTTTTTTLPVREPGSVPGWTVGETWGTTIGLTMFRGNPTRTFTGTGPLPPEPPDVAWRYPEAPMCRTSSVGGEQKIWCGMGWTGQPVVWERPDGVTEVMFGAYDGAVHFVNGSTGEPTRAPLPTGDIIKGSVTLDPDGFPLLYFGSRDNLLRVVALDRSPPELLWSLDAAEVDGIWNNDWDSNPLIVDDVMYQGGENGWFFAYQLNRRLGGDGLVTIDPRLLVAMPGYDSELLERAGRNVSIESSPVAFGERVYFANSGGRVVGLDVSNVLEGEAPIVFDYWVGGDIDATMVADEEGSLYVAIEHEPSQMGAVELGRNREVGQLIKLDPSRAEPRVWGLDLTSGTADSGIWATPALHRGTLYVPTNTGELLAVDTATGEITWSEGVGPHAWSSPSVVGETLVVATCAGEVRTYELGAGPPSPRWSVQLSESCIEATPAIWDGVIYLGARDGFIRALR